VLILRKWQDADFKPYYEMNTDPEVMRYFPAAMTEQEAADSFLRIKGGIEERGWGVWAVEVDGEFAGITGLLVPRFALPCMPCTEILWRFRSKFWGRGFAHEAAQQALTYGFSTLKLAEIVAFTPSSNLRSIKLMERLEFTRDMAGDFEHPAVPIGNPLRSLRLYRKRPNKSPEQAPSSGTSPSGQEPRHC
jgi:RimJ/RimL family protein N-acetyltransferase